jgi:formylglycine-generating enzyme required for sulfatase activity/tRNA A-37 threonylcarbamoyl transferase component Bud32
MSPPNETNDSLPLSAEQRIDEACQRFEAAWKAGERPDLEDYLGPSEAEERRPLLRELLRLEWFYRLRGGDTPRIDEYRDRFPGSEEMVVSLLAASASGGPPGQPALPVLPGYEVLGELGRGGMSVVYQARQTKLNRLVALKMIRAGAQAGAADRIRFQREAEAIARLQHPNIVQIHEVGEQEGKPFFCLEFCAGGSLEKKLNGTPLPAQQAAQLVETLARAIDAAHQAGIIHRDLKPANVLLTREGEAPAEPFASGSAGASPSLYVPKITDFGLARRLDESANPTVSGAIIGTPSYMAPEQAAGKSKQLGPATDIYSLGAILYECLTGRPPFKAATVYDTLLQVVSDEPASPRQLNPQVPIDLDTVCLKCLHKEPNRRYASAAALGDDLGRFLAGEPILARPAGRVERLGKWARRRPTAAALLGVSVLAALGLAVLSVLAFWQRQTAVEALRNKQQAQLKALLSAHPRAVPDILDGLRGQPEVLPELHQVWEEPDTPANRPWRMRAALVLLSVDPELVQDALVKWMLEIPEPAELLVVRNALLAAGPRGINGLSSELWRQLNQPDVPAARRLRLLAVLAAFDPNGANWKNVDEMTIQPWLEDNPSHLSAWIEAFRPARGHLMRPLSQVFRTGTAEQRATAASILADHARDNPRRLAGLILEADDRQFNTLFPALLLHRDRVLPLLLAEVEKQFGPNLSEAAWETHALRQAGAGLALLKLGHAEPVWPLLAHSPYPETRSRLSLRLGPVGVSILVLVDRLESEKDVSIRRALILALGKYRAADIPSQQRQRLLTRLLAWYGDDPDAGIHGAIDWLLRHDREGNDKRSLDWGQARRLAQIDAREAARVRAVRAATVAGQVGLQAASSLRVLSSAAPFWPRLTTEASPGRLWYVNGQGQTLSIVDSREPFLMGSPDNENGRLRALEHLHWRRIDRRYAIGTKPVTVAQFQRFLEANPKIRSPFTPEYRKQYNPEADCPIVEVTWYEAAQYCRWLSEQEGFPEHEMVYPSVAEIQKCKAGKPPLRRPANYLKRKGYRLPTEAEWEFACRAGAKTSRFYGSSPDLLPRYAWYLHNVQERTWPVGQKRPNDHGLFDMHGNVWTWCQESAWPYPSGSRERPVRDEEDKRDIVQPTRLASRGASFVNPPSFVRAARRVIYPPTHRNISFGFRVARTCD